MAVKRKSTAARLKELDEITQGFNKKAGKNLINTLTDPEMIEKIKIEYIPTASLRLNAAIEGWPRGKFSLISGRPDSGKTYRLLEDIGFNMLNNPDFIALWVESESSLDPDAIEMFGIDKERFYYFEVGTYGGEKALDLVVRYAQAGVDMIVVNSLKCLTPAKEFVDSMEDQNVAIQARMNAKFMRVIIPTIAESGTALCLVQHMSSNIGAYMAGQVITGGQAIKYNNVLTIEFSKGFIDSKHPLHNVKDQYLVINAKVTKNHCKTLTNPYKTIDYVVRLGVGTDITGEIVEEAFNQNILVRTGGWIKEYKDNIVGKDNERVLEDGTKCVWNGMNKFNGFLDNNPHYFEYLKERVSGNIQLQNLSQEEIEHIEEEERLEKAAIEKLEKEIDEIIN